MTILNWALFSVLFFCSCSPRCVEWEKNEIVTPCFDSTSKKFPSQSAFNGIELELTAYPDGERLYGNIFNCPIKQKELKAKLTLPEEELEGEAYVLEGGQRIELPSAWIPVIKEAFKKAQTVTISFSRYTSDIPADGFYTASSFSIKII